ncbi:MAG: DNA-binding response regulator [Deltaproteobacteria bacterium CG_4_8_14_3_um_filter_45_9]|jgi:DNA-binding NtrC family response regulator|nr:MAG: DNA-binding response regulator [Deltaproteobacteria bacterium CG_4_8_14_3_um_filter_45_9]
MKPSILIVDDDEVMQETLSDVLRKRGYEIFSVGSGNDALSMMKKNVIDLILLDMRLPDVNGLEVLKKIKEFDTEILVIMMTAYSDVQTAVSAMKLDAYDYINKPFELEELKLLIEKGLETKSLINEVRRLHRQQKGKYQNSQIYGVSPQIDYVKELIGMISKTHKTSVLIQGESGTGKELAANAIHYNSGRSDKPLMKINCSAIPDSLLESELFGYEKGAFTDAKNTKKGLFELADGGTVFLDEIGDMNPFLQSKILRVLENQTFMRVGGEREIKVDVRITAATNKDLETMVKEGFFRKDLYYRLKVMVVEMPPLRDRLEDILLLSNLFIEENNKEYNKKIKGFSEEAKRLMVQYSWPGNVRELKNVIERAMILIDQEVITPKHLPFELKQTEKIIHGNTEHEIFETKDDMSLEYMEKIHLSKVLKRLEWNKSKASKSLGISRATLRAKIKKYDLLDN